MVTTEIKINYPKYFPESFITDMNNLSKYICTNQNAVLLKKLIEDVRMKEVYGQLFNKVSKDKYSIVKLPIICIRVKDEVDGLNPLKENEYNKQIEIIRNCLFKVMSSLKILRNAGIIKPEFISNLIPSIVESSKDEKTFNLLSRLLEQENDIHYDWIDEFELDEREEVNLEERFPKFDELLENIIMQLKEHSKTPTYKVGNDILSRKKHNFKEKFFIIKLTKYLKSRFNTPCHKIVAIITNVIFGYDDEYTEDDVEKIVNMSIPPWEINCFLLV